VTRLRPLLLLDCRGRHQYRIKARSPTANQRYGYDTHCALICGNIFVRRALHTMPLATLVNKHSLLPFGKIRGCGALAMACASYGKLFESWRPNLMTECARGTRLRLLI